MSAVLGRLPALLQPGDAICVVAPAGPVDTVALDRGIAWLRYEGFDVVEGEQLRSRGGHGLLFLAGDDAGRRDDLVCALLDPDIRAVVAARGGDGTPRLLDDLPWDSLAAVEPTIVAGLSDLTCLHQALAARLGWATLWSPMVASAVLAGPDPDAASRAGLLAALRWFRTEPLALSGTTLVPGKTVEAPLVGGTLALLSAMVGTPGFQPATGAIAIIEDIGERAYRLERFLTHLLRGGFFDGARGVAVGDLTNCTPTVDVARVMQERLGALGVPVVGGLAFGHGPSQASLWLGRPATLDAGNGTLTQARTA